MTKRDFVHGPLTRLLRAAELDVKELLCSEDETHVTIVFRGDHMRGVDITADSLAAIIIDVTDRAMY